MNKNQVIVRLILVVQLMVMLGFLANMWRELAKPQPQAVEVVTEAGAHTPEPEQPAPAAPRPVPPKLAEAMADTEKWLWSVTFGAGWLVGDRPGTHGEVYLALALLAEGHAEMAEARRVWEVHGYTRGHIRNAVQAAEAAYVHLCLSELEDQLREDEDLRLAEETEYLRARRRAEVQARLVRLESRAAFDVKDNKRAWCGGVQNRHQPRAAKLLREARARFDGGDLEGATSVLHSHEFSARMARDQFIDDQDRAKMRVLVSTAIVGYQLLRQLVVR